MLLTLTMSGSIHFVPVITSALVTALNIVAG